MSIRIYHLLRNNKEQGPFTAEELIQQNLKPYDLVWIDGRSAAWNYPGELPEFRMYVPLPGGNNSNTQVNKQQNTTISPSVQAAIAVNDSIAQPVIKQKPRYKISAAWSKIQTITTPAYKDVVVNESQTTPVHKSGELKQPTALQSHSLSWENAWFDWKKEEKTVEPIIEPPKTKPVAAPQIKAANENYVAPALETKYTESLDSLKEKYIENVLQQKQKRGKGVSFGKASEFVLPSIALLLIFSIGYWLLHNTNGSISALKPNESKQIQTEAVQNTNKPATSITDNAASNTTPQTGTTDKQNITPANEPATIDQAEDRKQAYIHNAKLTTTKQDNNSKQANKPPVIKATLPDLTAASQKIVDKPAKQFDPSVINNAPANNTYNNPSTTATGDLNALDNRPIRRRTDTTDNNTANQSSQKSEPFAPKQNAVKTGTDYVNVPKYIQMSDGSANLKIQNISDVNLDLVVVDVQYYDASGNFHKGETMYVHNLKAGKNVIIKTPKDTSSLYATSKVSLVSSDANNLYIVGDN